MSSVQHTARIQSTISKIETKERISTEISTNEISETLENHQNKAETTEEAVQDTIRSLLEDKDIGDPANHLYELVIVDLFSGAGGFSTGMIMGIVNHYSEIISQDKGISESEVSYNNEATQEWLSENIYLAAVNHADPACETFKANHEWAKVHNSKVQSIHPPDSVNGLDVDILIAGPSCQPYSKANGGQTENDQRRMSPFHVLHWIQLLKPTQFLLENVEGFKKLGGWDEEGKMIRDGSVFEEWKKTVEDGFGYSLKVDKLHSHHYGDPQSRKRLFIMGRWNYKPEFPKPTHSKNGEIKGTEPFLGADTIIDWEDLGESIWTRSRTLSHNTHKKIAAGIKEHCEGEVTEFAKTISEITESDLEQMQKNPVKASNLDEEISSREDPFLVKFEDSEGNPKQVLSTDSYHRSICSTYTEREDQDPRVRDPERPLMTIPATKTPAGIIRPFLIKYYGKSDEYDVERPMSTITTEVSMALIVPEMFPWGIEIKYRLLKPEEGARAQGFPESFEFATDKKTVKRTLIGNAVPVNTAKALTKKLLEPTDAPTFNQYNGDNLKTRSVKAKEQATT